MSLNEPFNIAVEYSSTVDSVSHAPYIENKKLSDPKISFFDDKANLNQPINSRTDSLSLKFLKAILSPHLKKIEDELNSGITDQTRYHFKLTIHHNEDEKKNESCSISIKEIKEN